MTGNAIPKGTCPRVSGGRDGEYARDVFAIGLGCPRWSCIWGTLTLV